MVTEGLVVESEFLPDPLGIRRKTAPKPRKPLELKRRIFAPSFSGGSQFKWLEPFPGNPLNTMGEFCTTLERFFKPKAISQSRGSRKCGEGMRTGTRSRRRGRVKARPVVLSVLGVVAGFLSGDAGLRISLQPASDHLWRRTLPPGTPRSPSPGSRPGH